MDFRPLGKRVVIKQDDAAPVSKAGILLPENWNSNPLTGKVIAVGPEVEDVTVSDKVMFEKHSAIEILVYDIKYLVLDIDKIIGVIR